MAKKNRNTFLKRQRELDRVQKAKEKMAKRQGAKDKKTDSDAAQAD
jgi:hypothetical protein